MDVHPCPVKAITIVDKQLPAGSERRTSKPHAFADDLPAASQGGGNLDKYLASLAQATSTIYLDGFAALEAQLELDSNARPERAARPPTPDDMIALLERSLRREMRQDERMLLETARKYRNQFAHLRAETHDLDFLLAANRVARGFGKLLYEKFALPREERFGFHREAEDLAHRWLGKALAWATTPTVVGSVIAPPGWATSDPAAYADRDPASAPFSLKEQLASQDGPVRKLKALLQSQMDKDDLQSLRQRLVEKDGYAGDDDAILLEFCVRESPPEVLRELSRSRRLTVLEKLGGAEGPANRDIDDQILELLGFTVRPRPRGIVDIRRLVHLETDRIKHADGRVEVLGAATAIASELERALIILLRFIEKIDNGGQLVAEVLRKKATADGQSQKIEKMSIGNLFAVLDGLVKALEEIEQHDDRQRRDNQYLLAVRNSALVKTARDLSMKRNRVIHFDKELDINASSSSRPDPVLRKAALEFGEHALQLLDVLCESEERLFPQVVRIEEIKTDSWGRQIIIAENDEGRREKIFTKQTLKPGLSYYMVPFNNPVRVDPLLVEAGTGIIGD